MAVQDEIDRLAGNVADTYSALSDLGAELPDEQNSDNMAATARTVDVVTRTNPTVAASDTGGYYVRNIKFSTEAETPSTEGDICFKVE